MISLRLDARDGRTLLFAAMSVLCVVLRPDTGVAIRRAAALEHLPLQVLWVWERPEDLAGIDPRATAIATLDQTIAIGRSAVSIPRRQPVRYPVGVRRIAVVRIETAPGARLDEDMTRDVSDLLLRAATQPGIAAFQVDFDARHSERSFYSLLLHRLRAEMPPDAPLSITALASWCSYDDWIGGLPVDEAVPMFFRMEPDRRHAPPDLPHFRIREPLCARSIGVSTHEIWPDNLAGKRVYIFPDRGWHEDLSLLARENLP